MFTFKNQNNNHRFFFEKKNLIYLFSLYLRRAVNIFIYILGELLIVLCLSQIQCDLLNHVAYIWEKWRRNGGFFVDFATYNLSVRVLLYISVLLRNVSMQP